MKQKMTTLLLLVFFADPSFSSSRSNKSILSLYSHRRRQPALVGCQRSTLLRKTTAWNIDMIYVGASPVIIQAMLGGQAGVERRRFSVVTNLLQGGDIVQVATTVPYAIQSLIVKLDIKTPTDLAGKKIGISRLGAIPHYTLQAIVKLYNVQGINIVQTGTTTQAITSLSQGLVDGIITSAPFTFRLMKDGSRKFVSQKISRRLGLNFLFKVWSRENPSAVKNRNVVIGMIKATMEGIRQMFVNEKQTKSVLAKYTRQTDPDILDAALTDSALDVFIKDPTVTAASIKKPIVQQSAQFNLVDAEIGYQHAADGILRQQLRRRAEALGMVGGAMEVNMLLKNKFVCFDKLSTNGNFLIMSVLQSLEWWEAYFTVLNSVHPEPHRRAPH